MTRPEDIWRSENDAKRRVIRSVWPALADALDGILHAEAAVAHPKCAWCQDRISRGTCNGEPICGVCVARLDPEKSYRVRRYGRE